MSSNIKIESALNIESRNTVPTASGLASSASGLAALAFALIKLYDLDSHSSMEKLSKIARLGSGSACRSMFGGFVHWNTSGEVKQLAPDAWWPELSGFVVVFSSAAKSVSSTSGMQTTVKTSSLFMERIKIIVPRRIEEMKEAISSKNFHLLAELTMKDSNSFHACCFDTFPPIKYLTDDSFRLMSLVHECNAEAGQNVLAYTFDAGQNGVILGVDSVILEDFKSKLLSSFTSIETIIPFGIGHGPRVIN